MHAPQQAAHASKAHSYSRAAVQQLRVRDATKPAANNEGENSISAKTKRRRICGDHPVVLTLQDPQIK